MVTKSKNVTQTQGNSNKHSQIFLVNRGGNEYALAIIDNKMWSFPPDKLMDLLEVLKKTPKDEYTKKVRTFSYEQFLEFVKTHPILRTRDWERYLKYKIPTINST